MLGLEKLLSPVTNMFSKPKADAPPAAPPSAGPAATAPPRAPAAPAGPAPVRAALSGAAPGPGPTPMPRPGPGPGVTPGPVPMPGPGQQCVIPGPGPVPMPGFMPGPVPMPMPMPGMLPGPTPMPMPMPGMLPGPTPMPMPGPGMLPGPVPMPMPGPGFMPGMPPWMMPNPLGPLPGQTPGQTPGLMPGQTPGVDPNGQLDPNAKPADPAAAEPAPDPAKIKDTANKLFQAMDGWGTNEGAVMGALRSCKTPAEVQALRDEYKKHFNRDLQSDLESELDKGDLAEANEALKGDPKAAAKAGLKQAVVGMGTDEGKVFEILEDLPADQRLAAIEELKGEGVDVMGDLGGRDKSLAAALVGDRDPKTGKVVVSDAKVAAVKLDKAMNGGFLGLGTDEQAVYDVLEKVKPEDRGALASEFTKVANDNSTFGDKRTLDQTLGGEFSKGEKDIAVALKDGKSAEAAAARIKAASEGAGTDEQMIFKTLEGLEDPQRGAVIKAYNDKYGKDFKPDPNNPNGPKDALDAMLHSELGDMDEKRAQQLKKEGKLTDEFAVEYAMSGVGTDEDMLKSALKGKSKDDIKTLADKYAAKTGKNLYDDIRGETSGRDGKELDYLLENGAPSTPAEKVKYANEMHAFERSGWTNGVSRFFVDMYSDSGEVLDMQNQRMNDSYNAATDGGKKELPESAKGQVMEFIDYNAMDLQNYQTAKDKVADTVAGTAAIVVAGVVTIATAGGASPALVAALGTLGIPATAAPAIAAAAAAGAGGLSSIIMKSAIKTGAYSNEELGADVGKTLAQMVTAGTLKTSAVDDMLGGWAGAVTTNPLGQEIAKGAMGGGINNFVGGAVDGSLDEKNYQGDFLDWLQGVGGTAFTKGAGGMAGGAFGELVGGVMPKDAPAWMSNPYLWSGAKNTIKGAAGGVGGNVFEGQYTGSWDDIALNWGKVAWEGGAGGLAEGIGDARKQGFQTPQTPATATPEPAAQGPVPEPPAQTPVQGPAQTPAPAVQAQTPVAPGPLALPIPQAPPRIFQGSPLATDQDVFDHLSR